MFKILGFFYNGWESGVGGYAERSARYRATWINVEKLFPGNRNSCLDRNLLQNLGLDSVRIKDNDTLFLSTTSPIFSVIKSGIRNDLWKY